MRTPDLSVVVVHHRGEEHLREALAAIETSTRGMGAETILVDNTSRPGALEGVLRAHPSIRRIRAGGNAGFAKGCRLGVEAASGSTIAFVNDDAVVETPALPRLLETLAAAPEDVTAVAGRLVDRTGERNDFSDGFLTFDGHAFQKDPGRALSELGDSGSEAAAGERLFACGGLMAVRREEFLSSGGFDDDYFAYLEDVDFGWRQWIFGRRILFVPSAVARHRGGATGEALGLFARGFLFEKNAFSTAWKNFDEEHFRLLMPGIFAAFVGRIGEMLATRNPGAAELLRDPYSGASNGSSGGASSSFWRRAFGISASAAANEGVVVDDPLTIAHLRALLWIHRHQEALAEKRRAVQARRRRSDAEIFARFPLRIVPTYPGDERFDGAWFQELLGRAPRLVRTSLQEIFG
ncbi:MAG TPA: glycosyltransferase family 2 protein [Thermoanaerobaculia bacterium]|nr:glycosyltransferase family 2 protein [Thermoanaerobaculia bacterium]